MSIADMAAGVLYTYPVQLQPSDRLLVVRTVCKEFKFANKESNVMYGLLQKRLSGGTKRVTNMADESVSNGNGTSGSHCESVVNEKVMAAV